MRPACLIIMLLYATALAAPPRSVPVQVAPFASPADLAALGPEIGRALGAQLAGVRVEARQGESEVTVQGRVEVEAGHRVRLEANARGQKVQVHGDLEHLDDLVTALGAQLRPLLEAADPVRPGPPRPERTSSRRPGPRPAPQPLEGPPQERPPLDLAPPQPSPEPTPPPPDLAPPPPGRRAEEVRVAVHIVGEPAGQTPAGLYGMGLGAQQALVAHLARQRIQAIPVRAVGLIGGQDALAVSLAVGAHHTLMARFEALGVTISHGEFGPLVLSGRLHVVLLRDGRLRLERSYPLPPVPFSHADPAAAVGSRAVAPLLDIIAADIAARLN
ncbi:MAG: hypothetical protein NZ890_07410 [Myxococcota bacterium]|nr:hypothetical protein [Myxococcota bacterium]